MSDDTPARPDLARPELLVPDRKLVTGDRAKRALDQQRKYEEGTGKRKIPPADVMSGAISRQEAMDHIGEAVAMANRKAYEELDDAIGERLEQMERVIFENVVRAIERRTWRYRIKMFFYSFGVDVGWINPVQLERPVDAVDALDPNVAAAAAAAETLRWREFPGFSEAAKAWVESGGVLIVPTPRKKGVDEAARIVAGTTDILRRAIDAIAEMEEPPEIADGVMMLALDEELFTNARRLAQEWE